MGATVMEQREFQLKDLWIVFKKCWYWLILIAIVLGVAVGVYTDRFMTKEYSSTVSYIVVLESSNTTDGYADMQRDLTLRTAMTPGVVDILMTRAALNTFTKHVVDSGYDYDIASSSLSVSLRDKGDLKSSFQYSLDVTVTTSDPTASEKLASAVTDRVNDVLASKGGFFRQVQLVELETPTSAYLTSPNLARNITLAVLIGAVVTYLVFLFISLLDATLVTKEDVQRYVNMPLLSSIPNIPVKKNDAEALYAHMDGKLLCQHSEVFAIEEAYRTLRTNLMYAMHVNGTPVYGVVSAMQSEGKSLNSANLATAFAQIGRKTIIVDCDLRRSTQVHLFGVEGTQRGVAEYLAGIDGTPAIVDTGIENLSLLCGGYMPPDPTSLLHSDRFGSLLDLLRGAYDCVIVDLPPAKIVPDALIVAEKLTGVLLVVEAGYSNGHAVRETVASLENVNAKIIGSVLNGVDVKARAHRKFSKRGYGYGYKKDYAYKYSYGYGGKGTDKPHK